MITVKDVLCYMETLAPTYMKMDWDNVGLLCGDPNRQVHKILIALDPFEQVCKEAKEIGADLIVTHHPLIFQAIKSITTQTSIGRSILFLCRHDISAINAHTNLDQAPGGVNDVLAAKLKLQNIQVLSPTGATEDGSPWGLLRVGTFDAKLPEFLSHVKQQLGVPVLRFVRGAEQVHKVAVGGGACAGSMLDAYRAGCDTFITSDIRYNQFWDAKDLGMNLIDAGHFYTENPICACLADKLQHQFPELTVFVSKVHSDCMEFA